MKSINTSIVMLSAALLGGCLAFGPNTGSRSGLDFAGRLLPGSSKVNLMTTAPHNFRQASAKAGAPVRRGRKAERFELRHGDCDGNNCSAPRARAEVELDQSVHPSAIGKDIWYGYSFFNANVPAFKKENSLRLVFGQWTMGGKAKPIFRFIQLGRNESNFAACDPRTCNTHISRSGDLVVQLQDAAVSHNWGKAQNDGYVCRLFDMTQMRGRWMDIAVNTNYGPGSDGYLRIWVNDELVCDYRGPVVGDSSIAAGKPPKHRHGIYSSWTKRWATAEAGRPQPNLVVYYDEFRVGSKMSDVNIKQLEAANVAPVD